MKVVAETMARGTERIGQAQRKGLGYLADAGDAAALGAAVKDARNAVRHQVEIEKAVLKSAAVLFPPSADGQRKLATLDPVLDQQAAALQAEVGAVYKLAAARLNAPASEPAPSEVELKAARTVVEPVPAPAGSAGGRGGFGGGGGATGIPGHMTAELRPLMQRKLTVQQIRDFISGEFEPVPVADVLAYFQALEKSGSIKLTEKTPEVPAKKTPAPKKK